MILCVNRGLFGSLLLVVMLQLLMACLIILSFSVNFSTANAQTCDSGDATSCPHLGINPMLSNEKDDSIEAHFQNMSPHRADVHYDDGWFGKLVSTVDANGGTTKITTFVGHTFFITMHGVREGLVDPSTDEQFFFSVADNQQNNRENYVGRGKSHESGKREVHFVLPSHAAPSETKCKDRYPVCKREATRGECRNNPGWMIVNCCQSCDDVEGFGYLLDSKVRCSRERLNATIPAWESGSLNRLFTKWAGGGENGEYQQYGPRVISSPNKVFGGEYDGPWIMVFDNFLNDYEVDSLLRGAEFGDGFQRSTDQGKVISSTGEKEKVVSKSRTSSNAWCRHECEELPGVQSVSKRIEIVTGIPQSNYESFQILRYQEGEYYKSHHDSSGSKEDKVTGHRILTFFLYLNVVQEGGETHFTNLGISVEPKKGRALVWPSVLNEDPTMSDGRMYHEARPVVKGVKLAANHWIHQYDFRNANLWGCSGSFA